MLRRIRMKGTFSRALGIVMLALDLWRRLPAKRRRKLLSLARRHGPGIARTAFRASRAAKRFS
jgi:hypothetical protein